VERATWGAARRGFVAAVGFAVLATLLPAAPVAASGFYSVNTTDDATDGACDSNHCSLREAIDAANADTSPGFDTIELPNFGFSPVQIAITASLPAITGDVEIRPAPSFQPGPPPQVGIVDAGDVAIGLDVQSGAAWIHDIAIGGFDIGVRIGADGDGSRLQGNAIGFEPDRFTARPNGDGVVVEGNDVVIGEDPDFPSPSSDPANEIANSTGTGVLVSGTASGVRITGSRIHDNAGLGIDLEPLGSDTNDDDDVDGGPNGAQNAPVVTRADTLGQTLTLGGTFDGAPNSEIRVDVYSTAACDPSGFGEGGFRILTTTVQTDADGMASWEMGTGAFVAPDSFVTATATASDGSTSEFSNCFPHTLVEESDLQVTIDDERDVVGEGEPIHYTIGVRNDGPTTASDVVVEVELPAGSTFGIARSGFAPFRACSLTGTTVSCPIDQLLSGAVDQVEVDVAAGSAGAATASASIASDQPDPDATNNDATETTTVALAAPTTFTVTSPNDADDSACEVAHCSLREAIRAANANPGRDTIAFALPGPRLIQPTSGLPALSGPVVVDATTQPGWVDDPIVELAGNLAFGEYGLKVFGGDTEVRGLILNRWFNPALQVERWGGNVIAGNWFGLDPSGTVRTPNNSTGIVLASPDNRVGGTDSRDRNVISGSSSALLIGHAGADRNVVQGNWIGLNASGTAAVAVTTGIVVADAHDNVIGGSAPGAGNVISGATQDGVLLAWSQVGPFPADNLVEGNLIGLNAAGTAAVRNQTGLRTQLDVLRTTIRDNTVSGNQFDGINLFNGARDTVIVGNRIGTDPSGATAIPNGGHGITTQFSQTGTIVGGTDAGTANTIAFNVGDGVFLAAGGASLGNSVHSNGGLGIDRGANGVTAPGFPRIPTGVTATTVGSSTTIRGSLVGASGSSLHRIEIFGNEVCDPALHGEGEWFVATTDVTTNASGAATFQVTVPALPDGTVVTATSTNNDQTSEFSACVVAAPPADDSATGSGAPGSTTSTDAPADGASPTDPVETTVTVPANVVTPAGVTIAETADLDAPPANYSFFGLQVAITAPEATAAEPLLVTFDLDATILPAGGTAETVVVFRDGVPLAECVGGDATPDPCVAVRESVGGGDVRLTVRTSHASEWNFGTFDGTVFVVTSADDVTDGACDPAHCSLREAIHGANGSPGFDRIDFAIPGAGVHTITPSGPLPDISDAVTLDGRTQPGYDGTPLIELKGVSGGTATDGLRITAADVTVGGLAITSWGGSGIEIVFPAQRATLVANHIGIDAAGLGGLANGDDGVTVGGGAAHIGGSQPGDGNVISGNVRHGIFVLGGASNVSVIGNRIGTNRAGSAAVGNGNEGVVTNFGAGLVVGGTGPSDGNLISGNGASGVYIGGSGSVVRGNRIGTDLAGTADLGNVGSGVLLDGLNANANNAVVGGLGAGEGNLVSGNGQGIQVLGAPSNVRIQGNLVGTTPDGSPLGNSFQGIYLFLGSTGIAVEGNTVAYNGLRGILLDSAGAGNTITRNSIHANGALGIDLSPIGPSTNDVGDVDGGSNGGLNWPTIEAFDTTSQSATVAYSGGSGTFTIELFRSTSCDPSGRGEGEQFIGAAQTITAGSPASSTFTIVPEVGLVPGDVITATATDAAGSTSEFGTCFVVTPPPPATYTVTTTDLAVDGVCDASHCSLYEALAEADADPDADRIEFDIPGAGPHTIRPDAELQPNHPLVIDGTTQAGYADTPLIVLDGSAIPGANGIVVNGDGTVIRGLSIGGYTGTSRAAIRVNAADVVIEANHLGVDAAGTTATPNENGVILLGLRGRVGGSTEAARNVISGNLNTGVDVGSGDFVPAGADNVVTGNYVGTDVTGTVAIPNVFTGVAVQRIAGTRIGGAAPGEGNLVSGNDIGIHVAGIEATGTQILGNRIGTDAAGTTAVPNNLGVGLGFVSGVVVGGQQAGAGNLISGNAVQGVLLGTSVEGTEIAGNLIGTDASGLVDLGNGQYGVFVATGDDPAASQPNRIGLVGMGNVISGNEVAGILVGFTSRPALEISSNVIGLGSDRSTTVSNGRGVLVAQGTTRVFVGDGSSDASNLIAGNDGAGVAVIQGGTGASVVINEIRDNGGLGIDLGDDGPTPNDPDDADDGQGNHLHNAPELVTAVVLPDRTVVTGRLDGVAALANVVHVYGNDSCDPSGFGEGAEFLGQTEVTTDADGLASFTLELPPVDPGTSLTATAIGVYEGSSDPNEIVAESSEFSPCLVTQSPATPTPEGTDVEVVPVDPDTGESPVTLRFGEVTTAGTTTLDTSAEGPAVPSGFQLGDPATYYEIDTTATFVGSVEVCISYAGTTFLDEAGLRLYHFDEANGTWQDVTTSLDTTTDVICGLTGSFSPFVVVERDYRFSGFLDPVDELPVVNQARGGQAIPVVFGLGGDLGLNVFATGFPASQRVACDTGQLLDQVEATVASGSSFLSYDPLTERYTYVWKTEKSWANTCRRLVLTFRDGSTAEAAFKFTK
jgi:CSLREA domain-containing protein/uncharacterized repeat protein (TIGR01451 family)